MTRLIVDLSGAAGGTRPGDKIVVWSPVHREGSFGSTVSPAKETLRLEEGVGEIEVEPGPLVVETRVHAIADTRPREVVVPDQTSVTLWELLEQRFTYTPPVISVVSQDRAAAEDAADRAESGADRVGTAEQVGTWAANAKTSETNATTAASDALTIKNSIPQTVATEVDTQVPPAVADAIAADQAIVDAAAVAAEQAVADEVGGTTNVIGYTSDGHANKFVKLGANGKLFISSASITGAGDPTNKGYVDTGDAATLRDAKAYTDDRVSTAGRAAHYRGPLPTNTDLNDCWGPNWRGDWGIDNSPAGGVASYKNLPQFRQGTFSVLSSDQGFTTQQMHTIGTSGTLWTRSQAVAGQPEWTSWHNVASASPVPAPEPETKLVQVPDAALSHEVRVQRARAAAGVHRVPGTAIALVFDHGTNNFNEVILPLLRERGIPSTIALNSQMYDPNIARYQHDNRTNWDIIRGWVENDRVEIANHGSSHLHIQEDPTALEEEIVGGLRGLEEALPGVLIDSWVQAAGKLGDYGTGQDVLDFANTTAGRQIYANHVGIVAGVTPRNAPLIGQPRVGMSRYWFETPTAYAATQNSLLNLGDGIGAVLSMHPETMGEPNRGTPEDIAGFLDWLVQHRDSGKFTLLTLRELSFAVAA